MYIYFGEFRYEIKKQLLYKQEELLFLKKNQAALLDILLEDVHSFHNKYDILDVIWANQDVSQQVVFQTVSELRSILGNEAIKTFSKKGYKWNLPIDTYETIKIKPLPIHSSAITELNTKQQNAKKSTINIIAFLSILIMIFIGGFLIHSEKEQPIYFHFLTFNEKSDIDTSTIDLIQKGLSELNEVNLLRLQASFSPSQAFASPSLALKRSNISSEDWLFWGESFSSQTGAFLRYGLSHGQIHWQGYVHAESLEKLPIALANRIKELFSLGLFSTSLESLDIQSIKTMLTIAPDDTDLLLLIARHYEEVEHYDVALSYLQKLLKLSPTKLSKVYTAQAQWKSAIIYQSRGQYSLAYQNLEAMNATLLGSQVWPLYFQYVETRSWLAYNETQYQEMQKTLQEALQVINLSRQLNEEIDPLLVFKFHILHSILSKKTLDEVGKYHHLNQAQALLIKHGLDESNLTVVLYHFALFAQQEKDTLTKASKQSHETDQDAFLVYLTKILELPRTFDNYWVHDAAFELLVNQYITQHRYEKAEKLFPKKNLSTKQLYLMAQLLSAQNKQKQARDLFVLAFDQARLEYDIRTGVDAAFWLYHFSAKDPKAKSEYRAYIESNTSKAWLKEKLNKKVKQKS